jgi:uncharacterized protein with von Willebrand factor type A (vWA) domain
MLGFQFSDFKPDEKKNTGFEKLLDIFQQLLLIFSGNVSEALAYMNDLDRQYKLTDDKYGIADFIDDLKEKGYLAEVDGDGEMIMTPKSEQSIRKRSLEEIFGKLKRAKSTGNHRTAYTGSSDENSSDIRSFQFGDSLDQIAMTESIRNAQINNGMSDDLVIYEKDLEVTDRESNIQTSTVLMIDISHSMILYGEDRITPAKKVALAMAEIIRTRYPKDTLDIIVFGNDAWQISLKDIPYLEVGPYHTNTVAGLELAMDILRRKRNTNKQIFMITDGKPSCVKLPNGELYKNSNGLDEYIVSKCLNMAAQARKLKISITTFMIAQDPYLRQFVERFTAQNKGKAFLTGLSDLGQMIFEDYEKNRIKRI